MSLKVCKAYDHHERIVYKQRQSVKMFTVACAKRDRELPLPGSR